MSKTIIHVENLGKKYVIRHQTQGNYTALRDIIVEKVKQWRISFSNAFQNNKTFNIKHPKKEDFWALKDVSFKVKQGEVIGIIGRNGAGKTTLLKILSRITEPTTGRFRIKGRVSSLLEVGTGFHPELTGRENIFLNGAVLGMTRQEIRKKFDEIVAFAEIEKFLDTPVKRYSSGMYVRLAFSVAAHLEPEVLIVDEVLAVGDEEFQKKCLGKMGDVSKGGRTILFVSHNMGAIQNLCSKAILLKNGAIIANGETNGVVEKYLNESIKLADIPLSDRIDREGSGAIRFKRVYLKNESEENVDVAISGQSIKFIIEIEKYRSDKIRSAVFAVGIDDYKGNRIAVFTSEAVSGPVALSHSSNTIEIIIPKLPLVQGKYSFTLFSKGNGEILDWIQNAGHFRVEAGDYYKTGRVPPAGQGSVLLDYQFKF